MARLLRRQISTNTSGPRSNSAASIASKNVSFAAQNTAATPLVGHRTVHSGAAQNAAGLLLPPRQASCLSTQPNTAAPPLAASWEGVQSSPGLAPAAATREELGHFPKTAAQSAAGLLRPSAQDCYLSLERGMRLQDPTMVWNNPIQTMRAIPRSGASPTEMW